MSDGVRSTGPVEPMIAGPSTHWHTVRLEPGLCFLGARLRPGYAPLVLSFGALTTVNRVNRGTDAVALLPKMDELCRPAQSFCQLAQRLLEFVTSRCTRPSAIAPPRLRGAVVALQDSGGLLDLGSIADHHSVDGRTIRRDFRAGVGLAPKDYSKILQFQTALRLMRREGLCAAAAAMEAGYTDQSHMTRRFRELGGFTPAGAKEVPLLGLPL